jgi:hypothetical protein
MKAFLGSFDINAKEETEIAHVPNNKFRVQTIDNGTK